MDLTDYQRRIARPTQAKLPEFDRNGRLKHVLFAEQFNRRRLERHAAVATMVRELARAQKSQLFLRDLLPHKRAMLYFTQASTRTYLSFVSACQLLGMPFAEIRDPSLSSEYKGESPLDSMRMFSSYFDLIVMRSAVPNFAEACAYLMNDLDSFNERSVPVINGGAGTDEHPTQALLDIYTIQRCFEFESPRDSDRWSRYEELRETHPNLMRGNDGKSYGFCGDIARGRTVRSLVTLLAQYENISMHFASPSDMRLPTELKEWLLRRRVQVYEHEALEDIVEDIDLLYMTRIQWEHGPNASAPAEVGAGFTLTPSLVERMKSYAPILHPFPRNQEIDPRVDHDPRAMYFRQARNGMWVRAALLAHLFDVEDEIMSYHRNEFSEYHNYNVRT